MALDPDPLYDNAMEVPILQQVEVRLTGFLGAQQAKIVRVHRRLDERVNQGDALFDVEGSKETTILHAQVAGRLVALEVAEGDVVPMGSVLARIEMADEAMAEIDRQEAVSAKKQPSLPYSRERIEVDIAVLGAGPGGYVAAIQGAKLGASVALVEKAKLGGTCLNWGCIPTKALVRSAEVYKTLLHSEEYGCYVEGLRFDMNQILLRKQRVVEQLVRGIHSLIKANGIKLIEGMGSLVDHHTIAVNRGSQQTMISARNIIIATGSKTSKPSIPGTDHPGLLDSRQALELKELPERMVIIGAGIIGMEFAFIFSSFGVRVSVLEYLDTVLSGCDRDICEEIDGAARRQGIQIYTSANTEAISQADDGQYIVSFTQGAEHKYLTTGKVLIAIGREPDLTGVNLDQLGLRSNQSGRGIRVNEHMQTNIPHIYAIGDVTDKLQLAHVASRQGVVAAKHIIGQEIAMDYSAVPSAIFTDPEIGLVGLSEATAAEKGISIDVGRFPFVASGKALAYGDTRGFVKVIKERDSGKVCGASIVGPHATDSIPELALAIQYGLTAEQIANTIHAHPTTAEAIQEAAMATAGGAIHAR